MTAAIVGAFALGLVLGALIVVTVFKEMDPDIERKNKLRARRAYEAGYQAGRRNNERYIGELQAYAEKLHTAMYSEKGLTTVERR